VRHVIAIVIDGETATVEKNKCLPSRPTERQHRERGYRKAQSGRSGERKGRKKRDITLFRNISRSVRSRRPLIGRRESRSPLMSVSRRALITGIFTLDGRRPPSSERISRILFRSTRRANEFVAFRAHRDRNCASPSASDLQLNKS